LGRRKRRIASVLFGSVFNLAAAVTGTILRVAANPRSWIIKGGLIIAAGWKYQRVNQYQPSPSQYVQVPPEQ